MAIPTPTVIAAAYTTGDASTYTVTPSPEPVIGSLLVLFSDTSHATLTAPTSTPTGKALDWQLRGQQDHPTDVRRIFAHTAPVHAGFTTGTITLTMTGNTPSTGTGFALLQCLGVDLANPIVRAVSTNANSTGITLTLPQPLSVMNRWLVFCQHRAQENTVPRASPWSELDDKTGSAPVRGGDVQWLPGVVTSTGILETSASATWTTSSQASIIALELRARQDRQFWLFDTVAASNDVNVNAGNASVAFTVNQPGMSNEVNLGPLGPAYVFFDVDDPTASIKPNAGVAAVSFTANQPTVTVGGDVTVTPTAATVTFTANQPTPSLKVNAGLAT